MTPARPVLTARPRLAWLEIIFVAVYLVMLSNGLLQRSVAGEQDIDGNAFLRLSWLPVYALTLALALTRLRAMLDLSRHLPILLALTALAAISFTWSIDPALSFRRGVSLAFNTLFALYLVVRFDWLDLLKLLGAVWLGLALLSLAAGLVSPDFGRHTDLHAGAWRGFWFEKNEMGGHMARAALLFGVLVLADSGRRRLWLVGLALSIALVVLSTSTTAMLGLLTALAVIAGGAWMQHSRIAGLILIWLGISALAAILAFIALAPDTFFGLFGKDATLTGRTDIWDALVDAIGARPWLGYGYGAFWAEESVPAHWVREAVDWDAPSAHNGWLEIALAVGLLGTGLFALSFILTLGRAVRLAVDHRFGLFALGLLVQFLLFAMSESILLQRNSLVWVTYIAVAALLAQGVGAHGRVAPASARGRRLVRSRLRSAEL